MPILFSDHGLDSRHENIRYKRWVDDLFERLDTDGNGVLDKPEMSELKTDINGAQLNEEIFKWSWVLADTNEDGRLSKGELFAMLRIYQKYIDKHRQLECLIKTCDANKDKKLDRAELRRILQAASGRHISVSDVSHVIKQYGFTAKCYGKTNELWSDPNGFSADSKILAMTLCTWSLNFATTDVHLDTYGNVLDIPPQNEALEIWRQCLEEFIFPAFCHEPRKKKSPT